MKKHIVLFTTLATIALWGISVDAACPKINQPPVAVAYASPVSGVAPLTVSFDATRSSDPDGKIFRYSWDFGDGETSSSLLTSHTYSSGVGAKIAKLTVYDNSGASDSATVTVSLISNDVTAPTVPTGLAATVISSTQINLTWNASTDAVGVAGYKVYRGGSQVGTVTGTAYSGTGLSASTAYSYTVAAYDTTGNTSAQSSSVSATTGSAADIAAPSVPTNLSGTAVSTSQINLTWSASTDNVGVTGYKIYRNGSQIATSASAGYSSTGLTANTLYNYAVAAYDAAGNTSAQTGVITVSTPNPTDTTAPTVPTGLSATAVSASQINLSWTASADAVGVTGYKVYRGGSQIGVSSGTSFSDSGLALNTLYSYTVAAYDGAGNTSAQSAAASATTFSDTAAPSVPTGLAGTVISSSQVNLTWTASTDNIGVTGYKVFRNGTQIATTATTSYSSTGLTAATTYSYTVAAYDAAGNTSAQSSAISKTTMGNFATGVPAGIYSIDQVVNKSFVDGVLIRLAWDQIEKTEGAYTFSTYLDQKVRDAQAAGQHVSIAVMLAKVPAWELSKGSTYVNNALSSTQPIPWGSALMTDVDQLAAALANHQIDGVALKNNPTVRNIDAPIGGLQSLRVTSSSSMTGYSIANLETAVFRSVHAFADNFPQKYIYFGLFGISDGNLTAVHNGVTKKTDIYLRDKLMETFNGVSAPKIHFFQEVLTGYAPSLNSPLSNIVKDVKDQAGIMFQACGEYKNYTPWTWCWYKRSPQDPNNSQSGTFVDSPDEGFKNGTTNYNARYYEIYNTDLNEATYATKFQQWHDTLAPYIQ